MTTKWASVGVAIALAGITMSGESHYATAAAVPAAQVNTSASGDSTDTIVDPFKVVLTPCATKEKVPVKCVRVPPPPPCRTVVKPPPPKCEPPPPKKCDSPPSPPREKPPAPP